MGRTLIPARRRGVELLDDPAMPEGVRHHAMADLVRSNTLFGGARAAERAIAPLLNGGALTLLDVGTGHADIPRRLRDTARRRGTVLTVVGVDLSPTLLRSARAALDAAVCGDAARLPLRNACVDVVACSQLLHHFDERGARALVAELHRVARRCVVVSDLRRSWLAAAGFWLGATALRFHDVTRHDGVVSVLRGFTGDELRALIADVTRVTPTVRHAPFWRLTAVWNKDAAVAVS